MTANQQIILDIDARVKSANAATSLRELKQITRELQSEALKYQGVNEEAFQAAQQAAAGLVDKMDDVREAISAAKGEPLEQLNSGFSLLKQSVFDLDFGKATLGINTMAKSIKSIDVGKLKEGFSEFAGSLTTLGKSLLTNPIFLLGSAIVLIITNFEKLKEAGGLVGAVFKSIGVIIDIVTKSFTLFTDALGLTNSKMKLLREEAALLRDTNNTLTSSLRSVEIARKEAFGESVVVDKFFQIYVDRISEVNADLLKFAKSIGIVGAEQEKMLGIVEIFADEIKDGLGNVIRYQIPEQVKEYVKSLNISTEKAKEFFDKYIEYRKSVIEAFDYIQNEERKQNEKTIKDLNNSLQDRSKIITNAKTRELSDLRINHDLQEAERKREYNKLKKDLESQLTIINDYFDGAIARQEVLAKLSLISNDELVERTKELNKQRFVELGKTNKDLEDAENSFNSRNSSNLKKYLQDRYKVILKSDIDVLAAKKTNLEEESSLLMRSLKYQFGEAKKLYKSSFDDLIGSERINAKQTRDIKSQNAIAIYNNERASLDKQMKLYSDDDAKMIVLRQKSALLESNHLLTLAEINADYEEETRIIDEKVIQNKEKTKQEEERIAKERLEIMANLISHQRDGFQEQANMADSELQRLDLGIGKYKDNTEEKISLIQERYVNEAAALRSQMDLEILAVDNNEEAIQRIREKYAEKQKLLSAKTADDKLKIEQEYIEKQVQNMQYGADMMNSIGDFMTEMDNIRRDSSGKLDLASQKAAFVRNKTLQTGAAIMNTAAGITKALSTENYAGAIAIGIAGAAQLAKILATRFEPEGQEGVGGGGGGSTTGGGGSLTPPTPASAPSAPLMGQGYLNQQFNPMTFGGAVGFKPGGEQRVFVLEQDITAMQNRVKVMTGRSTLSGTV